jgi:hypothetical protein
MLITPTGPADLGPALGGGETAHAVLVASAVELYQHQLAHLLHEHYDDALEPRFFVLLLDVFPVSTNGTD